jgi:hypothetical protein
MKDQIAGQPTDNTRDVVPLALIAAKDPFLPQLADYS